MQKTDSITISLKAFDLMAKDLKKYKSLKSDFDDLLSELTRLQNDIDSKTDDILILHKDKDVLKSEIDNINLEFNLDRKKLFNFSVQLGVQPTYLDSKFTATPYLGVGVGVTIFRF